MLDTLKAGQAIRCTVTKAPRAVDKADTIARLMRQDAGVQRGLRKAQRRRRQEMNIYNRGNRDWVSRERCAKIVQVAPGSSWKMTYTPVLAKDIASVSAYLKIESA